MFYRKNANARLLAIMIAVGVSTAALPAAAAAPQSNADQVVREASVAGLDLSRDADQTVMRHRIRVAAKKVCDEVTGGMGFETDDFRDCYRSAIAGAWTQLDTKIATARSKAMVASASASH